MEDIFIYIGQQGAALKVMAVCLVLIIIALFLKARKRVHKPLYDDSLPAGLWFYTQLLNLELQPKKANCANLQKIFETFLKRKYHIRKHHLKEKSMFQIVEDREEVESVLDVYGLIWNNIMELKQKPNDDVIKYIKEIKVIFKNDNTNVDFFMKVNKKVKRCNDC
jgi:hypothetical protein